MVEVSCAIIATIETGLKRLFLASWRLGGKKSEWRLSGKKEWRLGGEKNLSGVLAAINRWWQSQVASWRRTRLAPQVVRDAHRHLECLLVVQARIDAALVRALEVDLRQAARTTDALGDVFARQLDVRTAEA
jgi:hypothetical protein